MSNIGLREMRQEYLWFDGSLALKMETMGGDAVPLNRFHNMLNPLQDWGFAVTLVPYNEETRALLFGGEEIELFSGHGGLLTLQIIEDVDQNAMFNIRIYNVRLDGTVRNVCGVREFSPDGTFDLPAVSDLLDGFQILFHHRFRRSWFC